MPSYVVRNLAKLTSNVLRRRDRMGHAVLALIDALARKANLGRIDITLPTGARRLIGNGPGVVPVVAVKRWSALGGLLRRGSLGFAEAYINGGIGVEDLKTLFEYALDNEAALTSLLPRLFHATRDVRGYHRARANTRNGSRENIAAHYDLGNEFYAAWLDPTMLYSSGIYRDPDDSLEAAQLRKLDSIFKALGLAPGSSLLEIGCGWGQVALEAAQRGARVDAVTISAAQQSWAERRIADAGFGGAVDIIFKDYRDLDGRYDRIVSIEMIEAVGEENWSAYFSKLRQLLAPDGSAVLQAITVSEALYDHYRTNPDFIQRYIFPGGMLPTVGRIEACAHEAGLTFETVETFGLSYARTLADWRERFLAAWPAISQQKGFDERFRRTWLYYLIYCEVGFQRRFIDVGLYRLTKV